MARDERVIFRMQSDKKEQLQSIADEMGVTVSALCSVIVGQWLMQFNRVTSPLADYAVETMKEKFEGMTQEQFLELLNNPQVMEFINAQNKEIRE